MLEVGKLYICSNYFLLLLPDKDSAKILANVTSTAATTKVRVAELAYIWSENLKKSVEFCNPETPLLILNVENGYAEALAGNKILNVENGYAEALAGNKKGWFIFKDWLGIKEL